MNGEKYIPQATTPEEHLNNVEFQLKNIQGWMPYNKDNAEIKAQCLLEAAQALVNSFKKGAK